MTAYYNEFDPKAAAWLRELIKQGHIAPGDVDERSIEDVTAEDLEGYTQCHFFAGIGVWSYALRSAGWPDSRPVWTGSCPCQPFSSAGKGKGFADERHLWPAFFHLIQGVKPVAVFGEQVASKDGLAWLDLVQADLEGAGYASGAVDTCAAGFGAPHIRQRLYWVADSNGQRLERHGRSVEQHDTQGREKQIGLRSESGDIGGLGITDSAGSQQGWKGSATDGHGCATDTAGYLGGLGDTERNGRHHGRWLHGGCDQEGERGEEAIGILSRNEVKGTSPFNGAMPTKGFWRDADWLFCRDGKWRPVEPSTFPLAHGATSRVGRLRGYGNAIVSAQAQGFIEAYLEVENG